MVDKTHEIETCVICDGDIEHQKTPEGEGFWTHGHNALPVAKGQCCQVCNDTRVLPRRLSESLNIQLSDAEMMAKQIATLTSHGTT